MTYAIPGIHSPGQILQGWSFNTILSLAKRATVGCQRRDYGLQRQPAKLIPKVLSVKQWDFFGKASDFKTTKALLNTTAEVGEFLISREPATRRASRSPRPWGRWLSHRSRTWVVMLWVARSWSLRLWKLRHARSRRFPRYAVLQLDMSVTKELDFQGTI